MKTYTLDEIKKEFKAQGYKYVGLFDQQGKAIVSYNSSKIPAAERLAEVAKRLQSKTLPNGIYQVCGKNSVQKHIAADAYPFVKADSLADAPATPAVPGMMPAIQYPPVTPEVLTYDSAISLQTQIIHKDFEIIHLKEKIERLEQQVQDLLIEAGDRMADEKPDMMERAGSFLSDLLTNAAPILDKMFESRDRKLAIEEKRLNMQMQQQRPPAAPQVDIAKDFIMWFRQMSPEDDVTYGDLVEVYNKSKSGEDFISGLAKIDDLILQEIDGEEVAWSVSQMFNEYLEEHGS